MKKNLLILIISLLICVIMLEIIFRVISPKSPPETTYGKLIHKNSDGFRDTEFVIPKSEDTYRIFVLGDSFTWGVGINVEETIPKQLEKNLNEEFIDRNIEVVNAAIPGYNTVQERLLLEEKGLKYQPNMVILIYNLNDIEYLPQFTTKRYDIKKVTPIVEIDSDENIIKYSKNKGLRGFIMWFESKSKFIAFLVPRVGHLLRRMGLIKSLEFSWVQKTFQGYNDENPGWLESKNALQEMSKLCNNHGIDFIVAIYPLLVELGNYKGKDAHETVHRCCNSIQAPFVDLLTVFENKNGRAFWINYMDGHPNSEAHRLVAEALLPVVRDRILETNFQLK